MTPERIAEILAITNAATPEPWEEIHRSEGAEITSEGENVALVGWLDMRGQRNAAFIAMARTAVPELCAALEATQVVLANVTTGLRLANDVVNLSADRVVDVADPEWAAALKAYEEWEKRVPC
mgnify:FL=1